MDASSASEDVSGAEQEDEGEVERVSPVAVSRQRWFLRVVLASAAGRDVAVLDGWPVSRPSPRSLPGRVEPGRCRMERPGTAPWSATLRPSASALISYTGWGSPRSSGYTASWDR